MERYILKGQLKELIGDRRVKAAVFYTFNFDTYFFENYVMTLLVHGENFRNEAIYNNILWRRCAKEGLIPPVTVYCDHYAKDDTMAPTLGYTIRCVRLPGKRGRLVNFHPKECWLLLDNNELIQLNGSANLTAAGWCENLECYAVVKHGRNNYPRTKNLNLAQRLQAAVAGLTGNGLSKAESLISEALRYADDRGDFFSSLEMSFSQKLQQLVAEYSVDRIEVIAPYMQGEAWIIKVLQNTGIQDIRCLIPMNKMGEVILSQETFVGIMDKGVAWCKWKDRDVAGESRNLHAKVYRLHGKGKTITITGSVNFTMTAWGVCTSDAENESNVESALVHVEAANETWLEPLAAIDPDALRFSERKDVNTSEQTGEAGRDAPLLQFTINWKSRKLSCSGQLRKLQRVRFKELLLQSDLVKAKAIFDLSTADIRVLSRNSLIELVNTDNPEQVYVYYPIQLEIESRPLHFKLNPNTILNFWLSDDPQAEEALTGMVAEKVTDESGVINEADFEQPSLLNAMAIHFAALIKLERKLFKEPCTDRRTQFQQLLYYLTTENLDTLPFYLNQLREQAALQKITTSFFWMIQQLLLTRFYERALRWHHPGIASDQWRVFKSIVNEHKQLLIDDCAVMADKIHGLPAKAAWVTAQLQQDYA